MLFDDLLGIADPDVPLPEVTPDARRRRLTALINATSLARTTPTLFIIEDAHWVDAVSESMLTDVLAVIPQTPSMVLITARPEYLGPLTSAPDRQMITLAPLRDSDTAMLLDELLGSDSSIRELASVIVGRAAGNPFFAEEMVRELAQRGMLVGERGRYVCHTDVTDVVVPPTVQAAIEARIDRLTAPTKRMLYAASVIGARFSAELLTALGVEATVDELLAAELIDQVRYAADAEYAIRHPLIRAVAYESQLRADRAEWHRRLAAAIQDRGTGSAEEDASLIAEHLEAAGELAAAYCWHMRAGAWFTNRDVAAARVGWERARRIADQLPAGDPEHLSMRIAPRTMLCATDWQARAVHESWGRFAELRELCSAADDKVSLAIGMTGLATELLYTGRPGEGSRLVSEQMRLLESIGDPNLTIGLSFVAFANWFNAGEFREILTWSQTVIDLAEGDPAKGAGFGVGSPLAVALAFRGVARWWLGRPGWRQDLDETVAMARRSDPTTFALVVAWTYGAAIVSGVLYADDFLVGTIEETVQTVQRGSNDFAVVGAEFTLALALLYRDSAADRRRGMELMVRARDVFLPEHAPSLVPSAELWASREMFRCGEDDAAIARMREAVDDLYRAGRLGWSVLGTCVLVETLLERGDESDLTEAQRAINRLGDMQAEDDSAMLAITLLRLRALLSRAYGNEAVYRDLVNRYRRLAESLGFEGHLAWADQMDAVESVGSKAVDGSGFGAK